MIAHSYFSANKSRVKFMNKRSKIISLIIPIFLLIVLSQSLAQPVIVNDTYQINATSIYRGQCVKISGQWNETINYSQVLYNGTSSSIVNVSISGPYTNNWTNYTLCTNNSWLLGHHVAKLWVNDTAGNINDTLPYKNFTVWGLSNVSVVSPANNSGYKSGETIAIVCRVTDANTSSGIENYPVEIYDNSTDLGTFYTNSTGYVNTSELSTNLAEGTHVIKCSISDNSTLYYNTSQSSATSYILVDKTPPSIYYNANTDTNGTYGRNWIIVNVTATDAHLDQVLLYWNGSPQQFQNHSGNYYWSNITGLSDGTYTFYAWANDTVGNTNQTGTRQVTVDTKAPSVTLNSPANDTYTNQTTITFNCTADDNIKVANVTLYGNFSGSWTYNQTNSSGDTNTSYEFNVTLKNGTYLWNCKVCDDAGNCTFAANNWTVTVDTVPPTLAIIKPTSNYTNNAWVYVEISSNENLTNASLDWNGTEYDMTAINSTYWYYNVTTVTNGTYYFNVTGYDLAGNSNTTETKDIIVDTVPPTSSSYFKGSSGVVYQNDSWYNESSITVIITANDSLSGVKGIWYSPVQTNVNRGEAVCNVSSSFLNKFTPTTNYTIGLSGSSNALRWIAYMAEDNAGNNETIQCIIFKQDTYDPRASWAIGNSVNGSANTTFNITVHDPINPDGWVTGISGINTTTLLPSLTSNCSDLSISFITKTHIAYNITNLTYSVSTSHRPETCLLNLTNVTDVAGNKLDSSTSTYTLTILGSVIKNMTDGQGHINYTMVNAMPNLSAPYNLTIYVKTENNTQAGVNITTEGLCENTNNIAPMAYNSTLGEFYLNCLLNRTKLEQNYGDYGSMNMTVMTYVLSHPSTNDTKNFTIKFDLKRPKFVFSWINVTTGSGNEILANPLNFTDAADAYYSPSERAIYFAVNVTDNGEVSGVSVNLSSFDNFPEHGSCNGTISLLYNAIQKLWKGNCTLGPFNESDLENYSGNPIAQFNITFNAWDSYNNTVYQFYNLSNASQPCTVNGTDCHPAVTGVILQDIGTPNMTEISPCLKTGPLTTNFSNYTQVPDMSKVNLNLDIFGNLSCLFPNSSLSSNFTRIATISFAGLNLAEPATAQKLPKLANAINISMLKPNSFGKSVVYINTTMFKELNANASVTIYHLPFKSTPKIIPESSNDTASIVTWVGGYDKFLGTYGGNLTFKVNGWSGYDIEDNVRPIINITLSNSTDSILLKDNTTVNVTVNGTGTEPSNITAYLDGKILFSYNSTQIKQNCHNTTSSWETVYCEKNITGLSEGQHSIKVVAYDFGNPAPGNVNTSWNNFTVAITPPEIVMISPENGGTTAGVMISSKTGPAPGVEVYFKVLDKAYSKVLCNFTLYHNESTGLAVASNDTNRTELTNMVMSYPSGQTYDENYPQYYWNLTCWDNASKVDPSRVVKSETWMFYWDRTKPNETILTQNGTVFRSDKATIKLIPTDNLAKKLKCELYNSGKQVSNEVLIANNTTGQITTYSLSNGQYNIDVVCADNAGNIINKTVSVTISKPKQTSSGGGGGVPGPAPAPQNVINLNTQHTASFGIMSGYSARFTVGNSEHELELNEIVGNKAVITIHSNPITITLTEGQTKDVDLNGDGVNDIAVTLVKIYNGIRAEVSIKNLHIAPATNETNTTNNNTNQTSTNTTSSNNTVTPSNNQNSNTNQANTTNTSTGNKTKPSNNTNNKIWIAVGIIILAIIVIAAWLISKESGKPKKRAKK
uniref:Ig-like domain-containing protein n=1 Tax=uncultured euryarchaeote Alv-FOS5 TaxID=337891 RepID=Q3SBB2_9EURY|nr:hypothetical protein [uncultured euryarchaeote Alv-FOS5]